MSLTALISMVTNIFYPSVTYALTAGPSQPEFSSFEPVSTTSMVDEFTGDFTYNLPILEVPGPHGSSYPLSLSYHSTFGPEEESSWVGLGWTLNPGAINRNTQGFPDDYRNKKVTYHNKMPNNWTVIAGGGVSLLEVFGFEPSLYPSFSSAIRYNNYQGIGYSRGITVTSEGVGGFSGSLGYNFGPGESSFSLNISPMGIADRFVNKTAKIQNKGLYQGAKTIKFDLIGSDYGIFSFSEMKRPTAVTKYIGVSTTFTLGILPAPAPAPAGPSANMYGKFNIQDYEDKRDLNAFGYMYSSEASGKDMMDYTVEKESTFDKRDIFLGIPFNSADNFLVTGEGIGGGFRMYQKQIGQFGPNFTDNETGILNAGFELELGTDIGGGLDDFGEGYHNSIVTDWNRNASSFAKLDGTVDEAVFFRFNNDKGGSWEDATGNDIIHAEIKREVGIPGAKKFNFSVPNSNSYLNNGKRSGRSSYIGYHSNKQILAAQGTGANKYMTYSRRQDINNLTNHSASELQDNIGEIVVYNEAGNRYLYGLPVYSRNERNLQYGLNKVEKVVDNYLAYGKDDKTLLGQERVDPYASSFLLTEINTSDYVDRTLNGPTPDDFGGYVKFNYKSKYGYKSPGGSWYKWRIPYNGLLYNRNSLSDPKDDLGSVSEGEKEIFYVEAIETKTHKAIFYTSPRTDGVDAEKNVDKAIADDKAKGLSTLEKLDKIELYAVDPVTRENKKLIKTVYFHYAEGASQLCQNVPNATAGKLTLEKVTFEFEGIKESQISYAFGYKYPDFTKYPAKYRDDLKKGYDHYKNLVTATFDPENPSYSPFDIDAWGNYQYNGRERYKLMQDWLGQRNLYDGSTRDYSPSLNPFDPAAWQLKTIKLPSGGEIHVQYEQDDYCYVQDQPAHVMASVSKIDSKDDNKYYINTKDAGLKSAGDLALFVQMLRKRYVTQGNRIYFKFLYRLVGRDQTPELKDCNAEYIDGYVKVESVGQDPDGQVYITLESGSGRPRKICRDFYMTQRAGNLNDGGNCDASAVGVNPDSGAERLVRSIFSIAKRIVVPNNVCKNINPQLSYFRVPTSISKKGGGLRVKRLLMYDQGLEQQPVLYGNEYDYNFIDPETKTLRSSGVATNEPGAIREENILIDFIAKKKQTFASKVIAGRDKEQTEGFIGESILPGPQVGYRYVTIKNIHSGVTNPGFSVSEFYTAYDYPVKQDMTTMENKRDFLPLPGGLVNYFVNNNWATQGFRFVLNAMHGQAKRKATYGGDYQDIYKLEKATLGSETVYEYFEPGEGIPTTNGLTSAVALKDLGKEVDITYAQKAVKDILFDANIEVDASLGFFFAFPVPYLTGMPSITAKRSELYTHATSKVIRYPAVVKSINNYQDGIRHVTKYVAFDELTGNPVATISYDDFKGGYLAQNVPAAWEYKNMGQKAENQDKLVNAQAYNANFVFQTENGKKYLAFNDANACKLLNEFYTGDLLVLNNNTNAAYHVAGFDYVHDRIELAPSQQGTGDNPGASFTLVHIVESGKNNKLNASAGEVIYHSPSTESLAVPVLPEEQFSSNDFTTSLNSALSNPPAGGNFILAGPFANVNIAGYGVADSRCTKTDLSKATVKDVTFRITEHTDRTELYMISLWVNCNGSWIEINQ